MTITQVLQVYTWLFHYCQHYESLAIDINRMLAEENQTEAPGARAAADALTTIPLVPAVTLATLPI